MTLILLMSQPMSNQDFPIVEVKTALADSRESHSYNNLLSPSFRRVTDHV
jgi:hypothetical protein